MLMPMLPCGGFLYAVHTQTVDERTAPSMHLLANVAVRFDTGTAPGRFFDNSKALSKMS